MTRAPLRCAVSIALAAMAADTQALTAYAIAPPNVIVTFDTATPGTASVAFFSGIPASETVIGADIRPATGVLYALTRDAAGTGRVYTLPFGGAATLSATLAADPADLTNPYTVLPADPGYGVDFNPVPDRLRITAPSGLNLRVNVATGLTTTDGALNPGTPNVTASAYTNNYAGATSTTLFDIDIAADSLYTQNPPNNGTLVLTGPLGVDATAANFDIVTGATNVAFATLVVGGTTGFYSINLVTGAATLIGTFAGDPAFTALSVVGPVVLFADSFE